MQPHQERVVTERADLAEKVKKLDQFIRGGNFGGIFPSLAADEKARLRRQAKLMEQYLEVLDERIAAFSAAGESRGGEVIE
jgi:hypothetical protein